MKSFVTQKGDVQLRLENFSGLQAYAPQKGGAGAQALCNLRCMPDGTLRRRDGVRTLVKLPEMLRGAIWSEREAVIYAAAGEHIYAIFEATDGAYTWEMIGQMQSRQGTVEFFSIDDRLVMMDGVSMYVLTPTIAELITPYIPLYGKDWTGVSSEEVYEQRNVLTDQIHVRYLLTERAYTIRLSVTPASVDAIYRDGMLQATDTYTHYQGSGDISFHTEMAVGTVFDMILTLPSDESTRHIREDFLRCRCAIRPGEQGRTVMLFGGGDESGVLYLSETLTPQQRERCYAVAPQAVMLYVLPQGRRELGDGAQDIRAMVRHYDRTLVMTPEGTWTTDMNRLHDEQGGQTFLTVNSTLGCSTRGGALTVGNSPMSICGSDILLWNADTDELDQCNAQSMAQTVRALLADGLGRKGRIYYDSKHDEVIFYLPGESVPCMIWQRQLQCWTTFGYGGQTLQGLFSLGEMMGVLLGDTVCVSEDALPYDIDAAGEQRAIACRFVSHDLGFEHSGESVRPYAVRVCAHASEGQQMTLSLRAAGGKAVTVCLQATGETPCEMQKRVSVGRCRHARVELQCDCLGAFSVRLISIAAGK